MKIKLNEKEKKFLDDNNFLIDLDKDYTEDEYLRILEDLYFQEVSHVGINEEKANIFAKIADIVAN